jgi:hypothetical protein
MEACRARLSPLAQLEYASATVTLPVLDAHFRALPRPNVRLVEQVSSRVLADLSRQIVPPCKSYSVDLGKWTPEADQAYGSYHGTGRRQCMAGAPFTFEPAHQPPNVQLLGWGDPQSDVALKALAQPAIANQPRTPPQHARSRVSRVLNVVGMVAMVGGVTGAGVYLIATAPQPHGISAGRLAGGIPLTLFGGLLACVALGPCAV